jgi:hypothetical protein
MTDVDAPLRGRRPGGQPKGDRKKIALSLRLSPALHRRLLAMAEENGRSVTAQSELLLDQAINGQASMEELTKRNQQALQALMNEVARREEVLMRAWVKLDDKVTSLQAKLRRSRAQR